MQDNALIKQS